MNTGSIRNALYATWLHEHATGTSNPSIFFGTNTPYGT
jgi:hypothetical protein